MVREGLDETAVAFGGDAAGFFGDHLVVHGRRKVGPVGDGDVKLDVEHQALQAALLVLVDADLGVDLKAADEDLGDDDAGVGGGSLSL